MDELTNEPVTKLPSSTDGYPHRKRRKDIFPGLFILIIGVIFLLKQTGVIFPYWFFTWPVLLVALGVFSGIKHDFNGGGWLIPIIIGGLFILNDLYPDLAIRNYIWPVVIIVVGLLLMIRPKKSHRWKNWDRYNAENRDKWMNFRQEGAAGYSEHTDDFLDVTSVCGGVKKIILSKSFKGGEITNLLAGTEVNLSQSDINGVITIDATNIFGGTKLIIPPTWDVQSEVVAIFGGVDDKRQVAGTAVQHNKVLRLEGTCIFGGIDIRSY